MPIVCYLDLESIHKVSGSKKGEWQISEIGAMKDGKPFRGKDLQALEVFIRGSDFICGHNLIDHDLEMLSKAGLNDEALDIPAIDTLYLSPLLFPDRDSFKLSKDYLQFESAAHDPVIDAELCCGLLSDLHLRWEKLPLWQRLVFQGLLHEHSHFSGFFQWLCMDETIASHDVIRTIHDHAGTSLCISQDLKTMSQKQPVELAYALAQIMQSDPKVVWPAWALHNFPKLGALLNQLRGARCTDPKCSYCWEKLDPERALKRHFGYDSFRPFEGDTGKPLQQQVVESALDRESLIAIFPTGGGKSLTFQLPALMANEAQRALTVVISPLQSLMKDQVDVLQGRHDIVGAVAINGLLSPLERLEAFERVASGEVALIYLSPESLRSNTIVKLLQMRNISRFVIDEAHCFSSWGQDFRTDYLYIGRFIRKLHEAKILQEGIPISCFTATARPAVIRDIEHYFSRELKLDMNLFQTFQMRPNLHYHVIPCEGSEEKKQRLLELLDIHTGPKIIYVSRTKKAEKIALLLNRYGHLARAFHGKMDRKVKMENQDAFMNGEVDIMVATTAFGMGVDKDDVSTVIHFDISDSLENYMQESGRAGRSKNLQAHCYLLFDEDDLNFHYGLLRNTQLSQREVARIWQAVKHFRKETIRRSALELATYAGWDTESRELETRVKAALAALEHRNYLLREENDTKVFATSIFAKKPEEANEDIEAATLEWNPEEAEHAKRIYNSILSLPNEVKADYLAKNLDLNVYFVNRVLVMLTDIGLLGAGLDLEALAYSGTGKHNSEAVLQKFLSLEGALFSHLFPNGERTARVGLRQVNQQLLDEGIETNLNEIREVLNYWSITRLIRKERLDALHWVYRITLRKKYEAVKATIVQRQEHALKILSLLMARFGRRINTDEAAGGKRMDTKLRFNITKLKKEIENTFSLDIEAGDYERMLLFFHFLHAIELESGMLVFYQPMRIQRTEKNLRKGYTKEDHQFLEDFYTRKTQQINIVGKYATLAVKDPEAAKAYTEEYFRLGFDAFVQKHYPTREARSGLNRAITETKFQELFSALSDEQMVVIEDKKSERILVAAGPGSGKTRILVHKVASLIWLEQVKPEQLLMLTFSRPAAYEMRYRLKALGVESAWHIDIHTYHSYAFHLLGQLGDLEKSDNIIQEATEAIWAGDAPKEKVEGKTTLVIDEYQDVSEKEFQLIEAIILKAENIRVLAVGDDDQNIYQFRGTSVEYMRRFQRAENCTTHHLTTNYRSAPNLVAFANRFLAGMSTDRVKADTELRAHTSAPGQISVTEYTSDTNLILPMVEAIAEKAYHGTTGILTRTNDEAMLIHNQLQQLGIPARLVTDQSGYRLGQLLELQWFTWKLSKLVSKDQDQIAPEDWNTAIEALQHQFKDSDKRWLAELVIDTFRSQNSRIFYPFWCTFIFEAQSQDFFFADGKEVLVSTMHKAKGKEFDRVFVLLSHRELTAEEHKRVAYVAFTRSKQQLHIHTRLPLFRGWNITGLEYYSNEQRYPEPTKLWYTCSMKDVYLSYSERPQVAEAIKSLHSGMELQVLSLPDGKFGLCEHQPVVVLSKKAREQLENRLAEGYRIEKVKVDYLVRWRNKQEGSKEVTVVLPVVELGR